MSTTEAVEAVPQPRRRRARAGINVLHPEVRRVALELADGDARRIEVVSHEEAVVHTRRVV